MANYLEIYLNSIPKLKDIILSVISPYEIYCALTGVDLEVGGSKLIESPLRVDSKPTFGLFLHNKEDVVMFKDFAYESGDVFKFVKLFASYNDKIILSSLSDIAYYLNRKLDLDLMQDGNVNLYAKKQNKYTKVFNPRTARNIRFKSRRYTKLDTQYWAQYHISIDTLTLYDIRSVDKLLDEEGRILRSFSYSEICYAYVIFNKIKLYQPMEEGSFKWRNTCPSWYLQGWKQRKGLEKLIITKSMKDVMAFYEILGDEYDIIAPHSEGYNFPKKIVAKLNKDYKEIFVIYDFDRAGVNGANKLKNLYGWKPLFIDTYRIMINKKLKVIDKDISDLIHNRGLNAAKLKCKELGL